MGHGGRQDDEDEPSGRGLQRLQGLVRADNPQAYGKNVEVVGRDILRVPIRDEAEKAQVDTLLAATGDRMHGGGPEFVERLA